MSNLEFNSIEKVLNSISLPRLQIIGRFEFDESKEKFQIWNYELIYEHFTEGVVKLNIATQSRYGGFIEEYKKDGLLDPPMRIEADSKWDSIKLNMPLFYLFEDDVEKVDLTKFKETFKDRLKGGINS